MLPDPLDVTLIAVEALESLGVPYLITGSLASGLFGPARATMDADILADLRPEHAEPLVRKLSPAFYLDLDTVGKAIQQRGSFNAIHLGSAFKVDVFLPQDRPFDRMELERRRRYELNTSPPRSAYFASPEDVVLSKLEWYLSGGEVSERRWNDVLGVLELQGDRLDQEYLQYWAEELGVAELLKRARPPRSPVLPPEP